MTLVHHDRGSEFAVLAAGDGFAALQIHFTPPTKLKTAKSFGMEKDGSSLIPHDLVKDIGDLLE
jgi:hypothetical protein